MILSSFYASLPVLHILVLLGLLIKIILPMGFNSLNPVYVFTSYFKFYNKEAAQTSNNWRRLYVRINNPINYFTYFWLFVCLMCLIAFGDIGISNHD